MRDCVFLCLSHGFHVRNIVYSKFYEQLSADYRVVIVFPEGVSVPAADQHLLRGAEVASLTTAAHRFENAFMFLRKNVFAGRERTQTFNLIGEIERKKHPWLYPLANAANGVFGRIPAVGRAWQKIEGLAIRGEEFDGLLEKYRPKLVVTANYGTMPFEVRLLRAAHRHGVPTLALIPSFDNLSSKGVIGENPRHMVVWNQIMQDEAVSLYGFAGKQIHICGGLQFDLYTRADAKDVQERVLHQLGIDPNQPFVVIGTITPRYFANNVDIVDIVNDAIATGKLPQGLQIVVRLHPQVVDDPYFGDNLDQYVQRAAGNPRIKLSVPKILRWGGITPPAPEDGEELMVLLHLAAAAIMPASTLAIDACALGAPVIGIGFDGYQTRPYHESVRRTFDFTHYRRIVAQGGIRIAESQAAMIDEVAAYLNDRSRDQVGRARIISTHLGAVDGSAWQRVMKTAQQVAAHGI